MDKQFKPAGYNSASPYFIINGAQRFINLLHEIFQAKELRRFDRADGSIMHAEMQIDDSVIMLADATEKYPAVPATMHVYVQDVANVFQRAMDAGCELVEKPVQKGDPDMRGTFRDFAGNLWSVATQIEVAEQEAEELSISFFKKLEDNFNKAVVSNNIEEIKKCIADDWVLVDAQGGVIPGEKFLNAVGQGLLSHSFMTKEILRTKVYDGIAVITGRGQNSGTWQGQPMTADEWITDIYKKKNGRWVCVLTHLTPVKKQD